MRVLITGGTGTIGRRLVNHLIRHGHHVTVLSRQPYKPASLPAKITFIQWDAESGEGWASHLEKIQAVVNLAGAGIADRPWTDERKRIIRESRVKAGQAVVEAFGAVEQKPPVLIQASAIGYYGPRQDELITESSQSGDDFVADVCRDWEASTAPVEEMGVRRVIIRTGVVLDMTGGALPRMAMPFRFGAGGPVGSGQQWFSWVHYLDEVEAIRFLIETEAAKGPFNLTAPNPVKNREFAKILGRVMNRPALLPVPGLALKLIFGEMSKVLLTGQRVVPERLKILGYQFKYPEAKDALQDVLG